MRKSLTATVLVVLLISSGAVTYRPASAEASEAVASKPVGAVERPHVPGEVLVRFRSGGASMTTESGRRRAESVAARSGLDVVRTHGHLDLALLRSAGTQSVGDLMAGLLLDGDVEFVQPNFVYEPEVPWVNDPDIAEQWHFDNYGQTVQGRAGTVDADIDLPEAWSVNMGTTGPPVIVAVIDTGVAYNHPDLNDSMWDGDPCVDPAGAPLGGCNHGYDFENDDLTPLPDSDEHGTFVAGIVAAETNNSTGGVGVAPNAELMALKTNFSTSQLVDAIAFAEQNGARVINASFGSYSSSCAGVYDAALHSAIASFSGLWVASAGNSGEDHDGATFFHSTSDYSHATACWSALPNVIGVAATDMDDNLAGFSDYGSLYVDIAAPGYNTYSTSVTDSSVHSENFESPTPPALPAGWTDGGTLSNWGTLPGVPFFGQVLQNDLTASPYANDANSWVQSGTIDLSGLHGANFSFWTSCDTEYTMYPYDAMYLEVSADGINFDPASYEGTPLYWNEWWLDYLTGDVSDSGSATFFFDGLTIPSEYLTDSFAYRFRWITDDTVNAYAGCWVDNIDISVYGDGSANEYAWGNGTSFAAPHVSGTAALLWGYNPRLTTAQVRQIIMETGDAVPSLAGQLVSESRVNAQSALETFHPAVGFWEYGNLPDVAVEQATDGSGILTFLFRVWDGISDLAMTLQNFQYSIDGGSNWYRPQDFDASTAFSADWQDNSYLTTAGYAPGEVPPGWVPGYAVPGYYSFTFDTNNYGFFLPGYVPPGYTPGYMPFHGYQQSNTLFAFEGHDGAVGGAWVTTNVMTVDNAAPPSPTVTTPGYAETTLNADTFTVIGTSEAGSTVAVYNEASGETAVQPLGEGETDFSILVNLEQDAENLLYTWATDYFGNQSDQAEHTIVEDSTPPSLAVTSVGGDSSAPYLTNDATPEILVSGEVGMDCRWSMSDLDFYAMSPGGVLVDGTVGTIALPDQGADGGKTVHIDCIDSIGNANGADGNLDVDFTLDTAPPTVTSATASPDPALAGLVTVTVEFSDTNGMDNSVSPTVSVSGTMTGYDVAETDFTDSTWTGTFTLLDQDEEVTASIAVSGARDAAGNTMVPNSYAGTLDVDTVAPTADLTGLPPAVTTLRGLDVTVGGADVTHYRYELSGGPAPEPAYDWGPETPVGTHITATGLPPGTYMLNVIGRDAVGNWQAAPTQHMWTVLASPSFSPDAGTYGEAIDVTMSSNGPGPETVVPVGPSEIRYTDDGSDPTCAGGTLYEAPVPVVTSTTFKAVTCDGDGLATPISTAEYVIDVRLSPGDVGGLVGGGWADVPGGSDPTDTPSITTTVDFTIEVTTDTGTTSITIPAGTVITVSGGGTFDSTLLDVGTVGAGSISGFDTSLEALAALAWGIDSLTLEFSESVTIELYVGTEHDGTLLTV
ncbi:S8 family serine peptidase, partial [Patescibacteria group bacterium]